jgi:hypothetical protein
MRGGAHSRRAGDPTFARKAPDRAQPVLAGFRRALLASGRQRGGASMAWQNIVAAGYNSFAAIEQNFNDGAQDCTAAVWYPSPRSGRWKYLVGATGQGCGHAEMHALSQFTNNVCGNDVATFRDIRGGRLFVECESKPCCLYCSAVLGLLGIEPKDASTRKWKKRMGGTQWAITPQFRTFVANASGYNANDLAQFDSSPFSM